MKFREGGEMAYFKIFLVVLALVTIALFGLAISILLKKDGKFPNIHIGSNKHMKEKGITCAQSFDKIEQAKVKKKLSFKELNIIEEVKGGC